MRICARCRNAQGGQDEEWEPAEADCEVKGRIVSDSGRMIPYHGFLCYDHFEAFIVDGADLKIINWLDKRLEHFHYQPRMLR